MRTIAKLFGRSPFIPIQTHMNKVAEAVERLKPLTEAFLAADEPTVARLAGEITQIEIAADTLKTDITNSLKGGMFLPVDRSRLVQFVVIQDSIADKMQNASMLMTLKRLGAPPRFADQFRCYRDKNLETYENVRRIIHQLDELLEASFGGAEAQQVIQMVASTSDLEDEADDIQIDLLRMLFAHEDEVSHGEFYLWMRIFRQVGQLSDLSERLANRVCSTLQLK